MSNDTREALADKCKKLVDTLYTGPIAYKAACVRIVHEAIDELAALTEQPAAHQEPLTDERIDNIADLVIKAMPDGIRGFCKTWGWQQFARELLSVCGVRAAAPTVGEAREWLQFALALAAKLDEHIYRIDGYLSDAAPQGVQAEPPHVGACELGHATLEWWNGDRKITMYPLNGVLLKSWGPDSGEAAMSNILDQEWQSMIANSVCHAADMAKVTVQEVALRYAAPSVLYRPELTKDGNAWCALYGANIMEGVCGFGDTPQAAMDAFDRAWSGQPAQGGGA